MHQKPRDAGDSVRWVPAGEAQGRVPHGRATSWRPRPAQRLGSRGQATSELPELCDISAARGSSSVP